MRRICMCYHGEAYHEAMTVERCGLGTIVEPSVSCLTRAWPFWVGAFDGSMSLSIGLLNYVPADTKPNVPPDCGAFLDMLEKDRLFSDLAMLR